MRRANTVAVSPVSEKTIDGITRALTEANNVGKNEDMPRLFSDFANRRWLGTHNTTRRTHLGALFQGQRMEAKVGQVV